MSTTAAIEGRRAVPMRVTASMRRATLMPSTGSADEFTDRGCVAGQQRNADSGQHEFFDDAKVIDTLNDPWLHAGDGGE